MASLSAAAVRSVTRKPGNFAPQNQGAVTNHWCVLRRVAGWLGVAGMILTSDYGSFLAF